METLIQNNVRYLLWTCHFYSCGRKIVVILWGEESVTQALLTKSTREVVITTHHLVCVMTNEQIATSIV